MYSEKATKFCVISTLLLSYVQLDLHETDLLLPYLSHHLAWHCFWRFAQICKKVAWFAQKIIFVIVSVSKLFRNNSKNNFASKCCKFLANLQKSWNNMMSNVGLIIEYIDPSHIHLAVVPPVKSKVEISQILWPSQNIWTLSINFPKFALFYFRLKRFIYHNGPSKYLESLCFGLFLIIRVCFLDQSDMRNRKWILNFWVSQLKS